MLQPDLAFTRELLHRRHHLSQQQIDDLLGEKGESSLADKLRLMDKLQQMLHLFRIFHEKDIWFMLLKGPLLSQRIYDDPCYRYYGDFDILVKPGDVQQVAQLLVAEGFQPDYFDWPQNKSRQKRVTGYMNQYTLYHDQRDISIEIHWRLFKYCIIPNRLFQDLLDKEVEKTTLGGQVFWQFRHEMELLYLVIHGGIHAWWRLKWLVDIHEMLARFPLKEQKFLTLTRQLKAHRQVALCNALLERVFTHTPLLPHQGKSSRFLLHYALERMQDKNDNPHENLRYFWRRQRYRMAIMPGIRYKISTYKLSAFSQRDMHHPYLPPIGLVVIFRRFYLRLKQLFDPAKKPKTQSPSNHEPPQPNENDSQRQNHFWPTS